jgi:hypothetical protein
LIVVDEVSMLPLEAYHTLLSSGTQKILFLGDPVQLEAIGMGINIDTISGVHVELTEQMRQTGLAPVTTGYLAGLCYSVKNGTPYPPFPKNSPDLIVTSDHKEFADFYHSATGTKKILVYKNGCVNAYNRHISGGSRLFEVDDKVVIGAPCGDNRNGDILTVTDSTEHKDAIEVALSNGETVYHWKTKTAMDKALAPLVQQKSWKEFRRIKDKSVDLKHLFSCTAHKSQGSTYDTVFLDGTNLMNAINPG